jgi:fibronectin-binding autotransporter adhesin
VNTELSNSTRLRRLALLAAASAGAMMLSVGTGHAAPTVIDGATDTVPGTFASPFSINGGLTIGASGTGELEVFNGAQVGATSCGEIVLGQNSGAKGTLSVDGGATSVDDGSCAIIVGQGGDGVLSLTNGANLTVTNAVIGCLSGSTGTATVDGSTWTDKGVLTVGFAGVAQLNIEGGGNVTSTSGAVGGGVFSGLEVTDAGSQWVMTGDLAAGHDTAINILNGGLLQDGNFTTNVGSSGTSQIEVSGGNSTWTNTGALTYGGGFGSTSEIEILQGGTVNAGSLALGDAEITVQGAGSSFNSTGSTVLGTNNSQAVLQLQSGGAAVIGGGTGNLTLGIFGAQGSEGVLDIGGVSLGSPVAAGTIQAGVIDVATAGSQIIFDHTSSNYIFSTPITGPGQVAVYGGTTTLTANESLSGEYNVPGGTLLIDGLSGTAAVNVDGGALGGTGTIGGNTAIDNNATLIGVAGQVLTVNASLFLENGSSTDVSLGAPSSNALFQVNGELVIGGTLNVTDAGGFGAGTYRIFNYTGSFGSNGMSIGTVPNGFSASNFSLQTSVAGQVNLITGAGSGALSFWNGTTTSSTNTVVGGAGTWVLGANNWTDAAGDTSGPWTPGLAIFEGTAGNVTISNTGGAIDATTVQFAVTGYEVEGQTLTLTGSTPTIRVGDGTAAGANYVAAIYATVTGTDGLIKTDLGLLDLFGTNTYSGGTTIDAGTLAVQADAGLGAAGGNVTLNGGEFFADDGFDTARNFVVNGASQIGVAQPATLDITGSFSGSASLGKEGLGELIVSGAGGYSGALSIDAGTLTVNGALGDAAVTVQSGATLGGDGVIGGTVLVHDNGVLKGLGGQTLTLGGLQMTSAADMDVTLDQLSSTTPLFQVNGDLTLAGDLNITAGATFGPGLYRLIDYTGTLTDNGLAIGTTPSGVPAGDLTIQTSVADEVNLIYSNLGPPQPIQFWNGTTTSPTGAVVGGAGSWKLGPTNWSDANGQTSGAWPGGLAIFEATPGLVTVDDSAGAIGATGIQFAANGYVIAGGPLALNGTNPIVRVGDGTAAGASDVATINSVLTGADGLIKSDLGTLVLGGANSFSGGVTVMGGTLQVSADDNLGAVSGGLTFNGGGLAVTSSFTSARSLDFAGLGGIDTATGVTLDLTGVLSGQGDWIKSGAGELELTGAGSNSGLVTLAAGALRVDGSMPGDVVVQSGALLQGRGQVGSIVVQSGGTLAPGDSIGTITADGKLGFAAGSIYDVELNAAGQSDLTHATGAADILGGTVNAIAAPGVYLLGTRYTIVTADGGGAGAFTGLTGNLSQPFLQLSLGYDAHDVYLDVTRNGVSFCSLAETRNQCAAANGADSLGGGAVYDAIADSPDAASARRAFDAVSGEIHASVQDAWLDDSRFVRDAALGRLDAPGDGHVVWGQVFTADGQFGGDGNAASLDRTLSGFLIGADTAAGRDWRVGVLGGYTRTQLSLDARSSSAGSDDYHVGVYGGFGGGPLQIRGGAAYTWHDMTTQRGVGFDLYSETDKASAHAETGQVFGELAWRFGGPAAHLEPFAGIAYVVLHDDAFHELGGPAALKSDGGQVDATFASAGLRGDVEHKVGAAVLDLRASAAWRGASGVDTPAARMAFEAGGQAFSVYGPPIGRDVVVGDVSLGARFADRVRLSVNYDGLAGDKVRDNAVKLALDVSF